MFDLQGSIKSNSFKVKNFREFKDWFFYNNFIFGDAKLIIIADKIENDGTSITIGNIYTKYPSIFPTEETKSIDLLEEFLIGLRKHMLRDEAFCLVAQSNEGLKSQICSRLVVTMEGVYIDYIEPDMDREYFFKLVNQRVIE